MNEGLQLESVSWPLPRLGEALEALARRSGFCLAADAVGCPPTMPPGATVGDHDLDHWLVAAAERLCLEAEAVDAAYPELTNLLISSAPAILRVPTCAGTRFLALLPSRRRRLVALCPDLSLGEVNPETLRAALCRDIQAPAVDRVERLLASADIARSRRAQARDAILGELLAPERIGGCWLLRPSGRAPVRSLAREARLPQLFVVLVASHAGCYLLWISSWWLLGRSALGGRLDHGWLLAWGLVLLSLLPFRLLALSAAGVLSVRAGALLKRRLLFGALRMDPDEVRHLGAGQLLGRVMESEFLEQMAVTGGYLGLTAVVELSLAGVVLAIGAGGWLHVVILLSWMAATAGLGLHYLRLRRVWTESRLVMTNDLVERMVGHRTRLAQEARDHWNEGEDQALERYYGVSHRLDRAATMLQALVPRGWFIAGLLGLVPAFVSGDQPMPYLAIGVGGVLLGFQAFKDLAEGLERILAAVVAWERVRPFWRAASRHETLGRPEFAAAGDAPRVHEATGSEESRVDASPSDEPRARVAETGQHPQETVPLLDVRDLFFGYRDRAEPVLRGLQLELGRGDRLLLEGASGGGKSTLGMLLSSCRMPDSGLLLLEGLDVETLGTAGWRRRVVLVPQYHENHVLMGTLAFNLLMGRGWPPRPQDMEDAERACRALGLGPLLERMPAGLLQPVGETGWQLSHGERGRLYIARALLQGADVTILDESFAALDPETLRRTLKCVLERAPTLVAIAHP